MDNGVRPTGSIGSHWALEALSIVVGVAWIATIWIQVQAHGLIWVLGGVIGLSGGAGLGWRWTRGQHGWIRLGRIVMTAALFCSVSVFHVLGVRTYALISLPAIAVGGCLVDLLRRYLK